MANQSNRLLFVEQPHANETLRSFICRTAAANLMPTAGRILDVLGASAPSFAGLLDAMREDFARCAEILGVDEIKLRFVTPEIEGEGVPSITFHGLRLPFHMVLRDAKRVSPTSLRNANYYRYYWDLAPLNFCPESWEYLIHTCPDCKESLQWKTGVHIHLCNCGFDLRQAVAVPVAQKKRRELQCLARIAAGDALELKAALLQLHPSVRQLNRGDIISLATVLGKAANHQAGKKPRAKVSPCTLYPDEAVAGLSILMDLQRALKPGDDGYSPFVFAPFHASLRLLAKTCSPVVADWIRKTLQQVRPFGSITTTDICETREAIGMITMREAAEVLRLPRSTTRQLTDNGHLAGHRIRGERRELKWFYNCDVAALSVLLSDKVAVDDRQGVGGLSTHAVDDLIRVGVLRLHPHPAVASAYSGRFLQLTEFARFNTELRAAILPGRHDSNQRVTLASMFAQMGPCIKPWGNVLAAAIEGRLNGGLGLVDPACGWTAKNLTVSRQVLLEVRIGAWKPAPLDISSDGWGWEKAQEYLSIHPRDISDLVAIGMISSLCAGANVLNVADIVSVGETLISSAEIAAKIGISPLKVQNWCRRNRIIKRAQHGPMWPRDEVERIFAASPNECGGREAVA